jgi:hypothetical protein
MVEAFASIDVAPEQALLEQPTSVLRLLEKVGVLLALD